MSDLKIELGGGANPRGEGFINVDAKPCAEVKCDFDRERLPFDDDSAAEIYSSHCFEHLTDYGHVLHEIARVGKVGCRVEIRVPHWLSQMALCPGHRHTISKQVVENWCREFVHEWWVGQPKRLRLDRVQDIRWTERYDRARLLFPLLSEQDILDFIPGTAHETRFFLTVVPNA